jgi:hypothetical protein
MTATLMRIAPSTQHQVQSTLLVSEPVQHQDGWRMPAPVPKKMKLWWSLASTAAISRTWETQVSGKLGGLSANVLHSQRAVLCALVTSFNTVEVAVTVGVQLMTAHQEQRTAIGQYTSQVKLQNQKKLQHALPQAN